MGLLDRIRRIVQGGGAAVDAPGAAGGAHGGDAARGVDAAYARQLAALQEIRRSVADVMATRRRLESQADQVRQSKGRLDAEASAATIAGHDDEARDALAAALRAERQLPALDGLIADLRGREQALQASAETFGRSVEAFRIEKEMLRARAAAVAMEAHADDALAVISCEVADAKRLVDRASSLRDEQGGADQRPA